MKKPIIITLIIIILATGLFFGFKYYKKWEDTKYLVPEIADFSFDWEGLSAKQIIADLLDGYTTATISLKVKNFSTSKYTINSLFIKAYTLNDTYLAGQISPYTDKVVVNPNSETIISVKVDISVAGATQLVKQLSGGVIKLASNYYTKGIIGTEIKLKGNFIAEGVKVLTIPIDFTIDI